MDNTKTTPKLTPEQTKFMQDQGLVIDWVKKLENSRQNLVNHHWKWWEIDEFLRGNHYVSYSYNAISNTVSAVTPSTLGDGIRTKLVINKLLDAHRAISGFITKGDRGIVVIPVDPEGSEDSQKRAADLSSFAYFLYRALHIKQIEDEVADMATRRSLGVVKTFWDSSYNDGEGFFCIEPIDTYDFFWDPLATDIYNSNYVIHSIRKTVQSIIENPAYKNTAEIQSDGIVSESYAKSLEQQSAYPMIANTNDEKLKTVILNEIYYRKKNGKKIEIWVGSFIKGMDNPLRNEKTEFDEYPFVVYNTDHHPREIVGEGALKHLIPINRTIDRIESQVADYNNTFLKGSYITEKGSGVKVVNNKTGKIFQVNKGFRFDQQPMLPLPGTIFSQLENMYRYFDEISGINQAMQGDKPKGTRSAAELESLQEAGANNIQRYRDNMDIFLENLYRQLFKLAYRHYTSPRSHPVGNYFNSQEIKDFVSGRPEAKNKGNDSSTIIIPDDFHITISPDNLIGFTMATRFDRLMQMYDKQVVDKQAVLEMLAINGFQNIIERMAQREQSQQQNAEQSQQKQMMMEHQLKTMPTSPRLNLNLKGELNPGQASEVLEQNGYDPVPGMNPDVLTAEKENALMDQGIHVPPTPNPSVDHTAAHINHIKKPTFDINNHAAVQEHHNHIMGENAHHESQKMLRAMAMMAAQMPQAGQPQMQMGQPQMGQPQMAAQPQLGQ